MSNKIEEILAQCLSEIKAGKADLEGCLARRPEQREELEPLLRLALNLGQMPPVKPSADFRLQARWRLLPRTVKRSTNAWGRLPFAWPRRILVPALSVLMALLLGGGGVVFAAQGSLPGETLYPVKTSVERIRLTLALDAVDKAEFHLTLSQHRLEEVVTMAQGGRQVSPAVLETIAKEIDAALSQLRGVSVVDGQQVLGRLSSLTQEQQALITEAGQGLGPEGRRTLDRAGLISQRGHFIAAAATANSQLLSTNLSVNQSLNEVEIEGSIESLNPLKVAGQTVTVNEQTKIEGTLQVGAWVKVEGQLGEGGAVLAHEIKVKGTPKAEVELKGAITNLNPLTIAGFTILTDDATIIKGELGLGLRAEVKGVLGTGGSVLARRIKVEGVEQAEVEFEGKITSLTPLIIGGKTVIKDANTEVKGQLAIGALAEVVGSLQADGTILAKEIEVEEAEDVDIEFKGQVTALTPQLIIGGKTVIQDATTKVKGQLTVGAFAEVKGFLQADGTILAKRIKVEEAEQIEVKFEGQITALTPQLIIGGKTVIKNANTEVKGQLVLNGFAEVEGSLQADGTILAEKIKEEEKAKVEPIEVKFEGQITALTPQLIIGGKTVIKNLNTEVKGQLAVDAFAEVEGFLQADGTILAKKIKVEKVEPIEVKFEGQITALTPQLIIGGKTVIKDANTVVVGQLAIGAFAEVEGSLQADGTILAKRIKVEKVEGIEVEFEGQITALTPQLIIGGKTIIKDANTEVKGQLVLNGFAEVEGSLQADGTILAREIEVEEEEAEDVEIEFTGQITALTPQLIIGGKTVIKDANTVVEGQLILNASVKVNGSLQADGTILAKRIRLAKVDKIEQTEIEFKGQITALAPQLIIGGKTVVKDANTVVVGQLALNASVEVNGFLQADGSVLAKRIKVEGSGSGVNG